MRPDPRPLPVPPAPQKVRQQWPGFVVVDYTLPSIVNGNALFYCQHSLPFVMGTTGGDREKLLADVEAAGTYAVIAPNMGKQIVAFQVGGGGWWALVVAGLVRPLVGLVRLGRALQAVWAGGCDPGQASRAKPAS